MWWIKNITSTLSKYLQAKSSQMRFQSRGLMSSRDKLNMIYLHLQKAYGHQTRQGGDLPWENFTFKVIWPFGHTTNVQSRENLKNDLLFPKTCGHQILQGIDVRFNTQTPKLAPTSFCVCVSRKKFAITILFLFFYSVFGQTGKSSLCIFLLLLLLTQVDNIGYRHVWLMLRILIWHAMCFNAMYFRDE